MKSKQLPAIALRILCAFILVQSGCQKASNNRAEAVTLKSSAEATWSYWQALHQPYLNSNDVHLFERMTRGVADPKSQQYATSLVRAIAAAAHARCERISSSAVLNVDPDLANYAVTFVAVRREVVSAMTELAEVLDNPSGLPDAPDAAFGFLIGLLQHANDGDKAFWNALTEQVSAGATAVGKAQSRTQSLVGRFKAVGESVARLDTQEMSVRVKLAQRYNREFPASPPHGSFTNSPASEASPPPPTTDQTKMMRDLIGRKIGPPFGAWTFDSGEFKSFEILGGTVSGDMAQYEVKTHVQGGLTGNEHDFKLRLTYRNQKDAWALVFVEQLE